jgi:hypothetical protein
MKKALERAKGTAKAVKVKAEEAIGTAVTSGETVGAAFIAAYARGRMGEQTGPNAGRLLVGSVDGDLLAGLGMHAVGFVVSEKIADHAHALGNGALACYGAFKGFEFGRESKKKTSGRANPAELREHQSRVTSSAFDASEANVNAR